MNYCWRTFRVITARVRILSQDETCSVCTLTRWKSTERVPFNMKYAVDNIPDPITRNPVRKTQTVQKMFNSGLGTAF